MSILAFMIDASSLHFPDFGSGYSTCFAPSPTGYLHLGHAYSALMAWQAADRNPERFILRIDDLDDTRSRPEFEQALIDDLQFLGIKLGRRYHADSLSFLSATGNFFSN